MRILEQTNSWGEKREVDTINKLEDKFGKDNVVKIGKLGGEKDMIDGVDVEIIKDGKTYTGQIKPFSYTNIYNGKTMVNNTGNVKEYNTDWMIFTNNKQTLIFKNNTEIINGKYVFPTDSLIYTL